MACAHVLCRYVFIALVISPVVYGHRCTRYSQALGLSAVDANTNAMNRQGESPEDALAYSYDPDSESSNFLRRKMKIFNLRPLLDHHVSVRPEVHVSMKTFMSEEERSKSISASFGIQGSFLAFSASASMSATTSENSSIKTARTDIRIDALKSRATADTALDPASYLRQEALSFIHKTTSAKKLVRTLGTFYAKQVDLGGRFLKSYVMELEKTDNRKSVEAEVEASYVGVGASFSTSYGSRSQNTNAHTKIETSCRGGNPNIWLGLDSLNHSDIQKQWADSMTDDNLFAYGFQLDPIWEVIEGVDHAKAQQVKMYLEEKWKSNPPQTGSNTFVPAARAFGFKVGDQVRWAFSNDDIPAGAIGTVVGFSESKVKVKFPSGKWKMMNPKDIFHPPAGYIYYAHTCINDKNLYRKKNTTITECARICDNDDRCKAFEYGARYKENGKYQHADCQPQSSGRLDGCDGYYFNLDLYVKKVER